MNLHMRPFTRAIATTDSPLLGPSPHRVGLILNNGTANFYTVSFTGPAVEGEGIIIPVTRPPVIFAPGHWG